MVEANKPEKNVDIEALLTNAEHRTSVRTKWPDQLNYFPFNFSLKLQNFLLKIINFLFKDQREVNSNLITSLRESVAMNQRLIEQIATLRAQMYKHLSSVDSNLQQLNE